MTVDHRAHAVAHASASGTATAKSSSRGAWASVALRRATAVGGEFPDTGHVAVGPVNRSITRSAMSGGHPVRRAGHAAADRLADDRTCRAQPPTRVAPPGLRQIVWVSSMSQHRPVLGGRATEGRRGSQDRGATMPMFGQGRFGQHRDDLTGRQRPFQGGYVVERTTSTDSSGSVAQPVCPCRGATGRRRSTLRPRRRCRVTPKSNTRTFRRPVTWRAIRGAKRLASVRSWRSARPADRKRSGRSSPTATASADREHGRDAPGACCSIARTVAPAGRVRSSPGVAQARVDVGVAVDVGEPGTRRVIPKTGCGPGHQVIQFIGTRPAGPAGLAVQRHSADRECASRIARARPPSAAEPGPIHRAHRSSPIRHRRVHPTSRWVHLPKWDGPGVGRSPAPGGGTLLRRR